MAVTPNTDVAFLREVDEELRRDQAIALWRRWGKVGLIALVLLLVLLGGFLWWRSHQEAVAGERGAALQKAYDSIGAGKPQEAQATLAELADTSGGYKALALFTQADVLLEKKDVKGAAAKFVAIAGDTSLAAPFRDLAVIRQTTAEFDTLKPEVVIDRLRPYAVKGNPWFGTAGELTAAAEIKLGRRDRARALFSQIGADEGTPETIKDRAVQMASSLEAAPAAAQLEGKTKQ